MNKVRLFQNSQEEGTGQHYPHATPRRIQGNKGEKREGGSRNGGGEEEGEGRKLCPNMPDKQIEKYSVKKQ